MDRRTFLESVAGLAASIPTLWEDESDDQIEMLPGAESLEPKFARPPELLADFTTDGVDKDGHPWRQRAIHIIGANDMDRLDKFCAAEDILRAYRIDDMLLIVTKEPKDLRRPTHIVFKNWCVAKIDARGKIIEGITN